MAKDLLDNDTLDMHEGNTEKKGKPGRKSILSEAMNSAQKMRKQREKIALSLTTISPVGWDARTCIVGMSNGVYEDKKRDAWEQFGRLHGYIDE